MDLPAKLRKFRIFQDKVNLAHTSHWDMDYLGQAEFDALMKKPAVGTDDNAAEVGKRADPAPPK